MGDVSSINVILEVFGGVLSLVLAACLAVGRIRGSRLHALILASFCCAGCSQLLDATAWAIEGNPDAAVGVAMRVIVFLTYASDFVQLGVLAQYIGLYLAERDPRTSPRLAWVGWIGTAVVAVLLVVNVFEPVLYRFDAENRYVESDCWSLVSQGIMLAYLAVGVVALVRHRRALEPSSFGVLVASLAFIFVAYFLQSAAGGVMLSYLAVTLATVLLYLGVQVQQARAFQEQQLALERARIDLMVNQIQPHFMYNVLTAIYDLCAFDPLQAQVALREFATYLRGNVDALSCGEPIGILQELERVRTYVALERRRFGDRIRVEEDIAETGFAVPALTVQPLVENAVRHGVLKRPHGGTVRIATRDVGDAFEVEVSDDGAGFDPSSPVGDGKTHVGLANVSERVERMCGGELVVSSRPGAGTSVIVRLPKRS